MDASLSQTNTLLPVSQMKHLKLGRFRGQSAIWGENWPLQLVPPCSCAQDLRSAPVANGCFDSNKAMRDDFVVEENTTSQLDRSGTPEKLKDVIEVLLQYYLLNCNPILSRFKLFVIFNYWMMFPRGLIVV